MSPINRRGFLLACTQAGAVARLSAAGAEPNRIGLVQSSHRALQRPLSPEDPLDYEAVREMVWKSIEYAGGLGSRVRPGSWVVLKPNMGFLPPQPGYRSGDITDMRVLRAVLEYVARNTRATRVTVAEGGSYRGLKDSSADNVVTQEGAHRDGHTFVWPAGEFPGFGGDLRTAISEARAAYPEKRFDFVDLNYDGVRDRSGRLARVPVSKAANGAGAFSGVGQYFVTNTIRNCDYLISIPVVKCHMQCGITASLKNYIGTAPRQAYAGPGVFWNSLLHAQHEVEGRIDPVITDLASFHPPDFVVADGIRGLQYREHNNEAADQMIRSNMVLASRDPVAADALAAYLLGFVPGDIEYLNMAQARGMGRLELSASDVRGDDPGRLRARWAKPSDWHGRGNRAWLVTGEPGTPISGWSPHTAPTDTLWFERALPGAPRPVYAAAVHILSDGHRKGNLWVGAEGRVTATLNGQQVMREEGVSTYRVGQFQQAVELRPGRNLLEFRVERLSAGARLSALIVGRRNDGDTADGIAYTI